MMRSMTGYGRAQEIVDGRDISVELKSVNHRFFEFSSRVPRTYGYLEEKLKTFVQASVTRGKTEVFVQITPVGRADADVQVNIELAAAYQRALQQLGESLQLRDDLSVSLLSRFSDIFTVRKAEEDEDEVWAGVQQVAVKALASFITMREREGEKLRQDILSRCKVIEELVEKVEQRSPQTVEEYRTKLTRKLQVVLSDSKVDEQRILTEAAIYAEKIAVDEETVRLRSHLEQAAHILDASQPAGRKLDFLVQEMNREINTIGSKASDLEMAKMVVEMKAELEKIREQIQNLE